MEAADRMGGFLTSEGIQPEMVLCSPARRARETLARMALALDGVPVVYESRLYMASAPDLLGRLRGLDGGLSSVLLVGHNPGLEQLALFLSNPHSNPTMYKRIREKYPTAALTVLTLEEGGWDSLKERACALDRFRRPRDLA